MVKLTITAILAGFLGIFVGIFGAGRLFFSPDSGLHVVMMNPGTLSDPASPPSASITPNDLPVNRELTDDDLARCSTVLGKDKFPSAWPPLPEIPDLQSQQTASAPKADDRGAIPPLPPLKEPTPTKYSEQQLRLCVTTLDTLAQNVATVSPAGH